MRSGRLQGPNCAGLPELWWQLRLSSEGQEPGQGSELQNGSPLGFSQAPSGGKVENRPWGQLQGVQVGGLGDRDQDGGRGGEGSGLGLGCILEVEPGVGFADRWGVGVRQMSQG